MLHFHRIKDDQHAQMASLSVLVIPPRIIHTSRNIHGAGWLIDIFSPPRLDFSAKPGLVCKLETREELVRRLAPGL